MTAPASVRRQLSNWVVAASRHPERGQLTPGTALFAEGILDSVHLVDLILLIEELGGRELREDELTPEAFRSLDSIWAAFFPEEAT